MALPAPHRSVPLSPVRHGAAPLGAWQQESIVRPRRPPAAPSARSRITPRGGRHTERSQRPPRALQPPLRARQRPLPGASPPRPAPPLPVPACPPRPPAPFPHPEVGAPCPPGAVVPSAARRGRCCRRRGGLRFPACPQGVAWRREDDTGV